MTANSGLDNLQFMSIEEILLRGVPTDSFDTTVAEYAPRSLIPQRPEDKPESIIPHSLLVRFNHQVLYYST
jgi:hypothetical protein